MAVAKKGSHPPILQPCWLNGAFKGAIWLFLLETGDLRNFHAVPKRFLLSQIQSDIQELEERRRKCSDGFSTNAHSLPSCQASVIPTGQNFFSNLADFLSKGRATG
jgi:hypothetical protein